MTFEGVKELQRPDLKPNTLPERARQFPREHAQMRDPNEDGAQTVHRPHRKHRPS